MAEGIGVKHVGGCIG